MAIRFLAGVLAAALVFAACGGTDDGGVDGVRPFGGVSGVEIGGTRAVDFVDFRMNVTMAEGWQVDLNERFESNSATSVVIRPFLGPNEPTPSIAFLRPSGLVAPSELSRNPSAGAAEGTVNDLSEPFDLEAWVSDLPDQVMVSDIEATTLAGMAAVQFDLEVDADFCDRNCSFLLIESPVAGGDGFRESVWTGMRNRIIWADQDAGELPIVLVIAGDDEDFQQSAQDIVDSAEIVESPPG